MTQRTYILVSRTESVSGNDRLFPIALFADSLENGDKLYSLEENIAFVQTNLDIETLTTRLRAGSLSKTYFFLADITASSRAGNMVPDFWDFLHHRDKLTSVA